MKFLIFNQIQILNLLIICILVFETIFDIKYMILPDFSAYILIISSLVMVLMNGHVGPFLLAGLGAMGFILFLYLITRGKGMGFGDVKLALFMGLWLGYPNIILAFYIASIS